MQPPNVLVFSLVLGSIFVALDAYVLLRFRRFIRRHGLSKHWLTAALIVATASLLVYVFVAWRRHLFRMDGLDLDLFMMVCLWYLPKLPIAIALLITQVVRSSKYTYTWITRKPKPPIPNQPDLPSRRKLLERSAWSIAAVPYVMVANGMVNTLYDFTVHKETIVLPGLPRAMDGFTLVQISDIHAGSFPDEKPFAEVVRIIHALKPDAIVVTGDFVNTSRNEMTTVSARLQKIATLSPTFASLGNHDHYNSASDHRQLIRGIRSLGVDLLINEHRRIGKGEEGFVLAAIDNIGFKQNFGNLGLALQNVHPDEPTVLLAHDPTYWDKAIVAKAPVNLMLSGHTHGGQIAFSMLGFELSPASFVYEQVAGLYSKGEQMLYVNRGLGTVGPPLRIGVPPEVTVFTLRSPKLTDNMA